MKKKNFKHTKSPIQRKSQQEEAPPILKREDRSEKEDTFKSDVEKFAADAPPRAHPKLDPNAVKFAGPSDLDNSQYWSILKKTFVFGQIYLSTFASQYATFSMAYKYLL
jgi:hypothetical protein